jgi:hypothetical protein
MKCNELSKLLLQLGAVVDLYKNRDISFVLEDLKRLKLADDRNQTKDKMEKPRLAESERREIISKIAENINDLNIDEIEKKLTDEELFPAMLFIKFFAERVGIDIGSRQNKANAIHTILRYIDRMRIDSVIRKRNG